MGLVAAVYDADGAEAQVREYAAKLAAGPALAIAAIKRCVHDGGELPLANGLALEAELMEQLFKSKDADEGLHAFVEKRTAGVRRRMSTLDHSPRLVHRAAPSIATPASRSRSSTPPTASRSPR